METTNDNHLDNIIDDSYNPYEYELRDLSNNEYIQKLDKITSIHFKQPKVIENAFKNRGEIGLFKILYNESL